MKDYFFNARDDFHYDHSGYYGYIVFNGDTKTRDGLLKALGQGAQPGGLGWYRYGKSFRPANDGKMYHWYIRLHSGGNDKPAAQAVDDFLRGHLEPPKPSPQQPETQKLVKDLLVETLEHYEQSVEGLKRDFSELKSELQAGTAAQVELRDVVAQGSANSVALKDKQQELEETQEELEETQNKLTATEEKVERLEDELSHSGSGGLNEELKRVEKAKQKSDAENKSLKQEKMQLKKSLISAEGERDNWKQQFDAVSEENGNLRNELELARSSGSEPESKTTTGNSLDGNIESVLRAILPELHLVESSWDHLKFGDLNHEPVLRRLSSIVRDDQVPGSKAVQGADNWMELHIDRRHWRLYYCRKNSLVGDKIVAMIGKKGEQNQDMAWLRDNPPEVCLEKAMSQRQ